MFYELSGLFITRYEARENRDLLLTIFRAKILYFLSGKVNGWVDGRNKMQHQLFLRLEVSASLGIVFMLRRILLLLPSTWWPNRTWFEWSRSDTRRRTTWKLLYISWLKHRLQSIEPITAAVQSQPIICPISAISREPSRRFIRRSKLKIGIAFVSSMYVWMSLGWMIPNRRWSKLQ